MPFAVSSLTEVEASQLVHRQEQSSRCRSNGTALYPNGTGVPVPILRYPDRQNNASPPTELKMDWIHSFCADKKDLNNTRIQRALDQIMALNMNISRLPLRQLTHAPCHILRTRPGLTHITTPILQQTRLQSSDSLPKIAQSSVWTAMVPKFILDRVTGRRGSKGDTPKSKEWNPASFYIIIFILIGSQAIRMLALKNDYTAYTRSTDAKIQLLREVIERVKKGEKVDVEKLLGTGDAAKEREWEEVLREIEQEDSLWHNKSAAQSDQAQQEQKHQAEVSAPKEPVIPAEGGTNKEPPKDGPSRRKLNFF